jgi:hypothetical protein
MPAASRVNEVWSIDFLSDALAAGRRFRILAIVDDFTRVSPGILNGFELIMGPSSPVPSFTSGQRSTISLLNTYGPGGLLIMPLPRASLANFEMNV